MPDALPLRKKSVSVEFVQEQISESETQEEKEAVGESSVSNAENETTSTSTEQPFWVVSESSAGNPGNLDEEECSAETEQETLAESQSVEPVYFEGSTMEIMHQRAAYRYNNEYYEAASDYFEHVQGCTDVNYYDELFPKSDEQYYSAEDFSNCSEIILNLAKNEIYARHGRMFQNQKMYEYFLTRMWYYPEFTPEEFDENCLNEYEKANIELLVSLGA